VAAPGKSDGDRENLLPLVEVSLGSGQLGLGLVLLFGDAILVALEELERDRVRVVGTQEF
jgi:hypothetical protein